jgi:predicted lipid-binding transport protein (Tim44 family)
LITASFRQEQLDRVQFLRPDEFLSFLEAEEAQAASKEETSQGYKVKVKYRPLAEAEKEERKQPIAQTIFRAPRG